MNKAEKWDNLLARMGWINGPPVRVVLGQIRALNAGNQEKKKHLDSLSDAIQAWGLGGGDVDVLLRVREVLTDAGYKFALCDK